MIQNLNLFQQVQTYIDIFYEPEPDWGVVCCGQLTEPELLDELEPTFSQTLFRFIKQQNLSEIECYKNANLDRRLFSKIRSNDAYTPKKDTVFALILGLKLDLPDARRLLESAGYSLSHSFKKDTIIEYLISQNIYDIITVNDILDSFGCSILG